MQTGSASSSQGQNKLPQKYYLCSGCRRQFSSCRVLSCRHFFCNNCSRILPKDSNGKTLCSVCMENASLQRDPEPGVPAPEQPAFNQSYAGYDDDGSNGENDEEEEEYQDVKVEVRSLEKTRFHVFLEVKNNYMGPLGMLVALKKGAFVVLGVNLSNDPDAQVWMIPFESPEEFLAFYINDLTQKFDPNFYKIWSEYSLILNETEDVNDSLVQGIFLAYSPLIGYMNGVVSFLSNNDALIAKRDVESFGLNMVSFKERFVSDYPIEFKITDTPDVKGAALAKFKHFNYKTIFLSSIPVRNAYTGNGIVYLASAAERNAVIAKYSPIYLSKTLYQSSGTLQSCVRGREEQQPQQLRFYNEERQSSEQQQQRQQEDGEMLKQPKFLSGEKGKYKVYFKNFDLGIGVKGVENLFKKYGCTQCNANKKSKIYGEAYFLTEEERRKCIEALNNNPEYGKSVVVAEYIDKSMKDGLPSSSVTPDSLSSLSSSQDSSQTQLQQQQPQQQRQLQQSKVFFSGFAPGSSENEMKGLFAEYDVSFEAKKDQSGTTSGSGYITFRDSATMQEAITRYNGAFIQGGTRVLKIEEYNEDKAHPRKRYQLVSNEYYCAFVADLPPCCLNEPFIMGFFKDYNPEGVAFTEHRKYAIVFFATDKLRWSAIHAKNKTVLFNSVVNVKVQNEDFTFTIYRDTPPNPPNPPRPPRTKLQKERQQRSQSNFKNCSSGQSKSFFYPPQASL